jgi:plastocyanin
MKTETQAMQTNVNEPSINLLPLQRTPHSLMARSGVRIAGWIVLLLFAAAGRIGAATVQVSVAGNGLYFDPEVVNIQVGDTVEWVWTSQFFHTVSSGPNGTSDGLFESGARNGPNTFSVTFQNAGTFPYYCKPHYSMGMMGRVNVAAQQATGTTLANISTRLPVQTGDNALIGGFIITGTQPKKVIIRAIGPSLSLSGKLQNPVLQLFSGSTLLESNDNWIDSSNKQAIIDSTIPPNHDLEAAIVRTLPANGAGYTAVVRGVDDTTGIGVIEAYDLDRSVDSKLANISTRGSVETDPNVLIAGTIVLGETAQNVIIRAIGPSLSIAGKLADPTLQLVDANGSVLEANDNWVDSPNKQAIINTTVPPSHDLESAIVRTLPANGASYTAIVRGVNNANGIAVVEVYALQ